MGRSEGKLFPFLRRGLTENLYQNLYYEDDYREVIVLEFPRFNKLKPWTVVEQERLLKDWHEENGRTEEYVSYSKAKGAFQNALKRSVFLIELPEINKKLRFREATSEESKEKRRRLKEEKKCCINTPIESSTWNPLLKEAGGEDYAEDGPATSTDVSLCGNSPTSNPPSVESSGSSGYQSEPGDDYNDNLGKIAVENEEYQKLVSTLDLDSFDIVNYVIDNTNLDNNDQVDPMELDNKPINLQENTTSAVEEINATNVDVSEFVKEKSYWLYTEQLKIGSVLLLICEKQPIPIGSQIDEGSIMIPLGVLEQGYRLEKSVEIDGKQFLYMMRQGA